MSEVQKIKIRYPDSRQLYTYYVASPVKPGDDVLVPGPPWAPDEEQAVTVIELGSDYPGEILEARIPGRAPACEHRHTAGDPVCGRPAGFRVSRGRAYDAQTSCRQHLAATIVALAGQERRDITVTTLAGS